MNRVREGFAGARTAESGCSPRSLRDEDVHEVTLGVDPGRRGPWCKQGRQRGHSVVGKAEMDNYCPRMMEENSFDCLEMELLEREEK